MSKNILKNEGVCNDQGQRGVAGSVGCVAEVALAEAHVHALSVPRDVSAPLLK
jgi:hypothetical protein